MPYCEKCGAEIRKGDRFCSECGTPVAEYRPAPEEWRRVIEEGRRIVEGVAEEGRRIVEEVAPREECFGRRGERDRLGLVSFGLFILIVGYIWYVHPWITLDIRNFFVRLSEGHVVEPSARLIYAFAIFLGLLGVSNFVIAGARATVRQPWRRPLADILSGVFLVSFAYFVSLYGQGLLAWRAIPLLFFVIGGILIIVYGVIRYAIERT